MALQLESAVTTDLLESMLVPCSTTSQTSQNIAILKGVIESTAAATYATQQQVTSLSVDIAGKTSQADLTQASATYSKLRASMELATDELTTGR